MNQALAESQAPILLNKVVSGDRRDRDRRHLSLVREPLARQSVRRGEERRVAYRVPQRLWVLDEAEPGVPQVFEGEISLGGASWWTRYPPIAGELEVRFRIPHHPDELVAKAKVVRETSSGEDTRVQVEFTEVELSAELALARYLEMRLGPLPR